MQPIARVPEKEQVVDNEPNATAMTTIFFANEEPTKPSGFIVGLTSSQCYALSFPPTRWRAKPSAQSIAFDLEPYVPIDAESMAVDAKSTASGWLAIVGDSSVYQAEIETLRSKGHWLIAACPIVMLALDSLVGQIPRSGKCIVVWHNADSIDLIEMQDRVICGWRWIACQQSVILRSVEEAVSPEVETSLICVDLDEAWCQELRAVRSVTKIEALSLDLHTAAKKSAQQLANSGMQPRFNLGSQTPDTRDAIAPVRKPLIACFSALCFMLICLIVGLSWRTHQNSKRVRQLQVEQEAVFNRLFLGERVPVGLLARFESEHRQLLATKGALKNSPRVDSVLSVLHAFLSGTPSDGPRFRWDQLEFSPNQLVRATGVAKSFGDYEAVGAALRQAGFKVPPLSALQVSGGVSMRLERIEHVPFQVSGTDAVASSVITAKTTNMPSDSPNEGADTE